MSNERLCIQVRGVYPQGIGRRRFPDRVVRVLRQWRRHRT